MRALVPVLIAAAALSACATTGDAPRAAGEVNDPYEGFNRQMLDFNLGVDKYAIGPAADVYETVTPVVARDRVSDVLGNLGEPVTFVNAVLQGNDTQAADTVFRFLVNSTVGIAGLWDPSEKLGIPAHDEDFGQTLGVWGVDSGPYLVLPLMGPTTPRDMLGGAVDNAFEPLNWTEWADGDDLEDLDDQISLTRGVFGGLNARVALDDQFEQLGDQVDPYVALRRIYSSSRQAAIRNGEITDNSYDDLPDFDEFGDYEDETTEE